MKPGGPTFSVIATVVGLVTIVAVACAVAASLESLNADAALIGAAAFAQETSSVEYVRAA